MEIIPVIDLKGGLVVRARHGDRASYRPIETPLSPTSEPVDVVAGLLSLHPFRTLYVADLDAIEGRGDHDRDHRRRSPTDFPQLALWVDNGCAELCRRAGPSWRAPPAHRSCSGRNRSGTLSSPAALRVDDPRVILSLDFRGDEFLGPPELLARRRPLARPHDPDDARPGRQRRRPGFRPLRRRSDAKRADRASLPGGRLARPRGSRRRSEQAARPASWSRPPCTTAGLPSADLAAMRSLAPHETQDRRVLRRNPEHPRSSRSCSGRLRIPASSPAAAGGLAAAAAGAFPWGLPPI